MSNTDEPQVEEDLPESIIAASKETDRVAHLVGEVFTANLCSVAQCLAVLAIMTKRTLPQLTDPPPIDHPIYHYMDEMLINCVEVVAQAHQ